MFGRKEELIGLAGPSSEIGDGEIEGEDVEVEFFLLVGDLVFFDGDFRGDRKERREDFDLESLIAKVEAEDGDDTG